VCFILLFDSILNFLAIFYSKLIGVFSIPNLIIVFSIPNLIIVCFWWCHRFLIGNRIHSVLSYVFAVVALSSLLWMLFSVRLCIPCQFEPNIMHVLVVFVVSWWSVSRCEAIYWNGGRDYRPFIRSTRGVHDLILYIGVIVVVIFVWCCDVVFVLLWFFVFVECFQWRRNHWCTCNVLSVFF